MIRKDLCHQNRICQYSYFTRITRLSWGLYLPLLNLHYFVSSVIVRFGVGMFGVGLFRFRVVRFGLLSVFILKVVFIFYVDFILMLFFKLFFVFKLFWSEYTDESLVGARLEFGNTRQLSNEPQLFNCLSSPCLLAVLKVLVFEPYPFLSPLNL